MTITITIDNTEITLSGNSITFFDEYLGLQRTVVPKELTFNIENGELSVKAVARDKSPTGVVMREIQLGNMALEFDFTEFTSPEFQNKYLNSLFRSVMSRFGLAAHQVISEETGEVDVIIDAPAVPVYPPWTSPTGGHDAYGLGDKVRHNDKNWESTVAANVWEPGVSQWREI